MLLYIITRFKGVDLFFCKPTSVKKETGSAFPLKRKYYKHVHFKVSQITRSVPEKWDSQFVGNITKKVLMRK